jgi:hypothetical protein
MRTGGESAAFGVLIDEAANVADASGAADAEEGLPLHAASASSVTVKTDVRYIL